MVVAAAGKEAGRLACGEKIRRLVAEYGTPLYLLDASRAVAAMEGLSAGLARYYPRPEITYSVKTNYLASLLRTVLAAGFRLEVVSRHEMALARKNGAGPKDLLFNGPVKSAADLQLCHEQGVDVNVDSLDELEQAASIGTVERPFRLGIRVAARLQSGAVSRFGLDLDDAATVAGVGGWMESGTIVVAGLHLHHSSRRDAASFCERLDRLAAAAELLGIQPEYLDLGGGIGSIPPPAVAARLTYPIDSHEEFARTVGRHALDRLGPSGPRIVLEPGIGVLAGCMNYVAEVVAVKQRPEGPIAICDGSMFDVNPLRSAIHPPCELMAARGDRLDEREGGSGVAVKLYGGTCMEIDQLGTLTGALAPRVGDLVVLTNVGAYSCCLAPDFILPAAPVYSLDREKLVRPRGTVGSFSGAGQ
jgi:diaminopimelate decarboxylase